MGSGKMRLELTLEDKTIEFKKVVNGNFIRADVQ